MHIFGRTPYASKSDTRTRESKHIHRAASQDARTDQPRPARTPHPTQSTHSAREQRTPRHADMLFPDTCTQERPDRPHGHSCHRTTRRPDTQTTIAQHASIAVPQRETTCIVCRQRAAMHCSSREHRAASVRPPHCTQLQHLPVEAPEPGRPRRSLPHACARRLERRRTPAALLQRTLARARSLQKAPQVRVVMVTQDSRPLKKCFTGRITGPAA